MIHQHTLFKKKYFVFIIILQTLYFFQIGQLIHIIHHIIDINALQMPFHVDFKVGSHTIPKLEIFYLFLF